MSRFLTLAFILTFVNLFALAQVTPIYFDADGVITNRENAASYGVYGKLSTEDLWVFKKFDLEDNLTVTGSYKDEALTCPDGEFKFYESIYAYNIQNLTSYKAKLSDRYLKQKGVFVNGAEEGWWTTFYPDGKVLSHVHYVQGLLSGEAKMFSARGRTLIKGSYQNGKMVGTWYDVLKKQKLIYNEGEIIETVKLKKEELEAIN